MKKVLPIFVWLLATAQKDHYGLENMKHRAAEAGAEYHLYTEPGKGTRILIRKTA